MDSRYQEIEVLITVKTSPEPSKQYYDTVCVAGIRIDNGHYDWVRLYPIRFRHLDEDDQFRKYEVLRLQVRPPHGDSRKESCSPEQTKIIRVRSLPAWIDRAKIMDQVPRTTTCQLHAAALADINAPSLGMVDVAELGTLQFEKHPGWTPEQQKKLEAAYFLPDTDLFGQKPHTPPRLKAPKLKVKCPYRCTSPDCPGHVAQLLDWELTALQARFTTDEEAKKAIISKFHDIPGGPDRMLSFYVGNFFDVRKRAIFSILGMYYPPRSDVLKVRAASNTLF